MFSEYLKDEGSQFSRKTIYLKEKGQYQVVFSRRSHQRILER
ncbi:LytR family transcriptional regulator [Streptococcus ruminantium]|uniref:LytR family transcriptional regulator n=1 Tax=Streptococcus ruminantium TaxID=1917441 RepID=A0A2Z5TMH1_9STRE|nr:LytR family transcriptional regulator [Streptococcus ruminantium]